MDLGTYNYLNHFVQILDIASGDVYLLKTFYEYFYFQK